MRHSFTRPSSMFRRSRFSTFAKEYVRIVDTFSKRSECTLPSSAGATTSKYDVIVVGAGCIGSLVAFWLKKKSTALRILVIDRDLGYKHASTVRSNGGIRHQFTLRENVELSRFTAEFVQNIEHYTGKSIDIQFKDYGYLMLGTHERVALMKKYHRTLLNCDGSHDMLTPAQVKGKFPWLNTDDIEIACLGKKNEGWLDPWTYLTGMKNITKKMGVTFLEAIPYKFNFRAFKNTRSKSDANLTTDEITAGDERVLTDIVVKTSAGAVKKIEFKNCVLATGCETGKFAQEYLDIEKRNPGNLQYEIPIERRSTCTPLSSYLPVYRKRYMYSLECRNNNVADGSPLLVDPSGFMFRKENSNNFITGNSPSPEDEPTTDNLDVDYEYFYSKIWPDLAKRISCLEALKVTSGWAGFYDYNRFDQNGIIGPHPAYKNMIIASGFSGHGVMHSAAVGRGVAEFLLHGRYQTIDLSAFSFQRVIKNEPLMELAHV